MVDACFLEGLCHRKPLMLFLWSSKGITGKCLNQGFRQWKNWRKRLYFHHTVGNKQPHTVTAPFALYPQYGEHAVLIRFFRRWAPYRALLSIISLELQEIHFQPLPAAQPKTTSFHRLRTFPARQPPYWKGCAIENGWCLLSWRAVP